MTGLLVDRFHGIDGLDAPRGVTTSRIVDYGKNVLLAFAARQGYIPHQPRSIEGRLPETVHGRSEAWRPAARLVTLAPGGPGPRPPGTTTRPRGARCTDPEEMPEMEARAPAQNRHGGAPRGARLPLETQGASQAPGVPRHEHAGVPRHGTPRLSALRHPSGWRKESCKPRAQGVAGTQGVCE